MKDFKEQIGKPRVLALYANLTVDDYTAVFEMTFVDYDEHYETLPVGEQRERTMEGWVRISEPVEVQFSCIDNDSIVRNAVASLEEQERQLRAELAKKLVTLHDRKNQLLALTYQPAQS